MTRFGLDEKLVEKITNVLRGFGKVERAVIFGSRATGNYKNYSDIDIAVFAPDMSFEEYLAIRAALDDLPIIFTVDAVHYEGLGAETMKSRIIREGVEIYRRSAGNAIFVSR
ncbi:MAG: nucleotidyltransferase domain-containing protein [Nitrospinae bacterium]|nr:nucleotidyltransferase domain-containing protein [Nitrospinota bacterium]